MVAALAGRRGATRSRKRWIALGLGMVGIGAAAILVGALSVDASTILVGLVVGEVGLVLGTPTLVGLVARLGRLLPLSPRIALRDAARNRAAAAPAISAVMAAVAGSVALGMVMDSDRRHGEQTWFEEYPTGTVSATAGVPERGWFAAPLSTVEQTVRSTLPVAQTYLVGGFGCPEPDAGAYVYCGIAVASNDLCPELAAWNRGDISDANRVAAGANPYCDPREVNSPGDVLVADGAALATLSGASGEDLRRAQETLAAGGVVVRSALQITDGRVTLQVVRPQPSAPGGEPVELGALGYRVPPGHALTTLTVPGHLLTTAVGPGSAIVSAGLAEEAGLVVVHHRVVAATPRTPSEGERERLQAGLTALGAWGFIQDGYDNQVRPEMLILMAAAGVITLGAAGVGTGLAAADGRSDLSTLAAVGASPRLRRGLSVSQSSVIAVLGAVLGSLAGSGAAVAMIESANQQGWVRLWPGTPIQPVLPWLTLAVVLVAVPLVAVLGAGLLTRSRLPIERRQ